MDLALIQSCSDPALKPAIVEQFIEQAGSTDPLAVTVKIGGRSVLVPEPRSVENAMTTIRQYSGQAVVRVGITQVPAGIGIRQIADIDDSLLDPCENLRQGTAIFARIMRIVTKWYGNPKSDEALPQIFDDAVYAWKTGEFEGVSVFQADDPIQSAVLPVAVAKPEPAEQGQEASGEALLEVPPSEPKDAEIRIDLTGIGGRAP
ncbi:TraH family protein [Rhizobium sp. G187]|uniref:TraH family protein n=1 Tax=Rhizobium sp. G187 TaxID=3451352 RepID=UPI003EE4A8CA